MVGSSRPGTGPNLIISRHDGTTVNSTGLRTQFHAPLEPEVTARLDELFFKFLQRICSDCKFFLFKKKDFPQYVVWCRSNVVFFS